jgi:hypothetical protein
LTACRGSLPNVVANAPAPDLQENQTTVVKVREFKLPHAQIGTYSIIVGPDHNLWFTEYRQISRITVAGKISQSQLERWQSDPGVLTVGPDGNVWANSAEVAPPSHNVSSGHVRRTFYLIYRVSPDMKRTSFALPKDTSIFPTGLLNIKGTFYFGLPLIVAPRGTEKLWGYVTSMTTEGVIKMLWRTHEPDYVDGWIQALATPGPLIWLYDFAGGLQSCTLTHHCTFRSTGYPFMFVGNVLPKVMEYSPYDHDVYVANTNTSTIYRVSIDGKKLKSYYNVQIGFGHGALGYFHGNIWVTLNGDGYARPMLGRLTPSGNFTEISLPIKGPTYLVSALVAGPDGHLWYIRGDHVGEILSDV